MASKRKSADDADKDAFAGGGRFVILGGYSLSARLIGRKLWAAFPKPEPFALTDDFRCWLKRAGLELRDASMRG
jgi:hypothetical protein